ncbi:GGDEF domain-containing protein [Sporosarcina sp. Marseille-Q4063]|uniref:sensor domain-containing diguanylate cyclase n=1 Tax=Sporosarcina sp. Marseille-Q4063 TaxID=2810514 RepID=UPI001BAEF3C8|nr:sensor domain-containing diguanylate cyclase [Sporosarcina sp. Marseille-Q4063]QUW22508.1 GGDEF domain-containing protein [Sporosarcina sp. Marseille-Q4063]
MMKIYNRTTLWAFIVWLVIVPPGLIYLLSNYNLHEINWIHLFIYIAFGFITLLYPIKKGGQPLFLVMWVTIPVFLKYGIMAEIIVMQLSVLAFLLTSGNTYTMLSRFFLNSALFFTLSMISANVFHLVGGEIGMMEFWPVILVFFCYQFSHSFIRDLLLKLYSYIKSTPSNYLSNKILSDYASGFGVIPVSLTLYFLTEYVGFGAVFLLGVPFLIMTYMLRIYSNTEEINRNLQQAGEIGHQLSNNVTEKKVVDQFIEKVSEMFNAEYAYLFNHQDGWLELVRSYEKGAFVEVIFNRLSPGQGIAGSVLMWNKPIIYSKRDEWEKDSKDYAPDQMQSVLCLPISRDQNIETVLFLSTQRRSAFKEYHLQILDILCSYFTVSVEKARNVEEKVIKSERCALTKLYNFGFLEDRLEYEMKLVNEGLIDELSVLMLDIDHFKAVNDTYGHQSGNEVLQTLARILKKHVPQTGIVGRYGGEEFVLILPGMSKYDAKIFAEQIRSEIESYAFQVYPSLNNQSAPVLISITVSIGVSNAPEDADEAKVLLCNADRSLYLGAKQAGRNRVAGYIK